MELVTQHAAVRMQQRGIDPEILHCLLTWGREQHDHRGARIVYFDKHARSQLERGFGREKYKALQPHLSTYAVISGDGNIVTVGHRLRRIRR